MSRTLLRLALAFVAAFAAKVSLNALYMAAFPVPVDGPTPPLHVPIWLEPYHESASLLCDIVPSLILGAIARWRTGPLAVAVGVLILGWHYAAYAIADSAFSSWALDIALRGSMVWTLGVVAGGYLAQRWMPDTSLERTREG